MDIGNDKESPQQQWQKEIIKANHKKDKGNHKTGQRNNSKTYQLK